MTSRFNNLKQAIIQADKRKLAFRTYAGIGGLIAGSLIVSSVKISLEYEEVMAQSIKRNFGESNIKTHGKIKAGTEAVLETLPIAIFAGVAWPLILVRVLLDY